MLEEKIEQVINEKVKPYLREHNGDIKFLGVNNGVVEVMLLGQCSGCYSAKHTIEDVVETCLKTEIPEVERVELANYLSEEILGIAKKILTKNPI